MVYEVSISFGSKVIAIVKVDNRQTNKQSNRQTNKQTNKQTGQKQYAPNIRSGGMKIYTLCTVVTLQGTLFKSKESSILMSKSD